MNEAQTGEDLIDPAIEKAGWTKTNGCQVLVEQSAVQFAPGRRSGKYLAVENFEVVLLEVLSSAEKHLLGFGEAFVAGHFLSSQLKGAGNVGDLKKTISGGLDVRDEQRRGLLLASGRKLSRVPVTRAFALADKYSIKILTCIANAGSVGGLRHELLFQDR